MVLFVVVGVCLVVFYIGWVTLLFLVGDYGFNIVSYFDDWFDGGE